MYGSFLLPGALAVGWANENIKAADEVSETTKRIAGKSVLHSRSYIGDAREATIKTDHIEIRNETSVVKYLVVRPHVNKRCSTKPLHRATQTNR